MLTSAFSIFLVVDSIETFDTFLMRSLWRGESAWLSVRLCCNTAGMSFGSPEIGLISEK